MEELIRDLSVDNHPIAIQLAENPEHILGFDQVKQRHYQEAEENQQLLLSRFRLLPKQKIKNELNLNK